MRNLIICLFAFCLFLSVNARVYGVIDTFATPQQPLIFVVTVGADDPLNLSWYSPYDSSKPPAAAYHTTTDCFGGQRDVVLGHESITPSNSVSVISIVGQSGTVAFPLGYVGGAYFQYDGVDNGGTSNPFPGSRLNGSPGLPGANRDFTFGGKARYITCTIFADHPVEYAFVAIDGATVNNLITLDVFPVSETTPVIFTVDINDAGWSNDLTFNWANVAAFQVRVFTFEGAENSAAVDTSFKFLNIVGYEVIGTVVVDCGCDGSFEDEVVGSTVTLQNPTNGATLATDITDSNGAFEFNGLTHGNYRVCISNALTRCASTPQCRDFTLANLVDPTPFVFATTVASVLSIPSNANLECGSCFSTACLGFASLSGCSGTQQVTTFSDSTVGNTCRQTVSRSWTASGQTLTQIIVLTDTLSPTLTTPAQSLTFPCSSVTTPITTWILNNGNAVAADCSTITWQNNWDTVGPVRCGFDTVTFTASDPCGNAPVRTTATYTINDNTAPNIGTPATNSNAECDLKAFSDQTALSTWLNQRGGAQATDNCNPTVTWTNNFSGSLASGCSSIATVTFTASDGCGNSSPTTASFTIADTRNPLITVQAQNQAAQCSASGTGAQNAFTTWRNDHGGARATDQCITDDNDLIWTDNFTGSVSGGCSNAIPVVFTVTDNCGRSSTTSASFTVQDNTGPTLDRAASSLTLECGSNIATEYTNWLNTQGGASASDSCTAVVWTNNAGPVPTSGCNSVTTVTFVATDACSNPSVQTTATFTVRDTVPPFFTTQPQSDGTECSANVNAFFNTWLSGNAGAVASDSCSNPTTIRNDFPPNGTPARGCNAVTSVRFTAVDSCNVQSAPVTVTYTITDNTPPVISPGASSEVVECSTATNQQDYQDFIITRGGAVASDFCSTFIWTNNGPANVPTGCNAITTVTFTATDACNNFAQTTASFTVVDNFPPTLTLEASDLTTECSASTSGNPVTLTNWLNARGGAAAVDSCSPVTWVNDFDTLIPSGSCSASSIVTFTASDSCGASVTTTATFTVTDSTAPFISPGASPASAQCDPTDTDVNAFQDWVNNNGGARATDNCVPTNLLVWSATTIATPNLDTCSTTAVTFTVSDGCGGSASTTSTFTIIDSGIPQFSTTPQSLTVECDGAGNVDDYDLWFESFAGAVAFDACATVLEYRATGSATGPVGCGSTPITITVTDECQNSAIGSAIYTVDDTIPPTITVPATDSSVQCGSTTANNQAVIDFLNARAGAQATDICSSVLSWTNNYNGLSTVVCNPTARVTFTVADQCGNSAQTTASITIIDTLTPELTATASNLLLECNAGTNPVAVSNYVNSRGGASAFDTCSTVTWTNTFISAPAPCSGPIPVSFVASDACGNRITTTGSIEIVDSVNPEFVDFPPDTVITCDQFEDPDLTGTPGVFDVCSTVVDPTYTDREFQEPTEKFCPGDVIITRTWLIVDACGNSNERDQIIVQEIARRVGPCLPTECPPCELIECCTTPLEDVECNAVPCLPVVCQTVHCQAVPCIPQACGVRPSPTGKPQGPVPLPSTIPAPSCEPVYVYVFDDDGDDPDDGVVIPPVYTTGGASVLSVSIILSIVIILLTIL